MRRIASIVSSTYIEFRSRHGFSSTIQKNIPVCLKKISILLKKHFRCSIKGLGAAGGGKGVEVVEFGGIAVARAKNAVL